MGENIEKLNSTRQILAHIDGRNGKLTWTQIVRPVTALGVEVDPPVYGVLKQLLQHGYVAVDTEGFVNESKFSLTEAGRALLHKLRGEHEAS